MAVTMIMMTTFNTTIATSISSFPSSSSSPNFNYLLSGSERRKCIDVFPRRSTPTDNKNPQLSPNFVNEQEQESLVDDSASEVVRKFYSGINSRDLSSVVHLIADDCVYEDLVFPQPFVGRKAILEFFEKFIYTISQDLQFAIDDISGEDTSAVGVTWHLEWKGKPFPFSKGCSFYRLEVVNGRRKIIYGRDVVEPAVKPGDFALIAIRGVTWLLQRFPQFADRL